MGQERAAFLGTRYLSGELGAVGVSVEWLLSEGCEA